MKCSKFCYALLFTAFLAAFTGNNFCQPVLVNLTDVKQAIKEYYSDGRFEKDVKRIIDSTLSKLKDLDFKENPAFIFDVDETALSNLQYELRYDFGYFPDLWAKWIDSAKAKAIPEIRKFYEYLLVKDVKIIFLTGRSHKHYQATLKNLIEQGYFKFDTLICRNDKELKMTASAYKENKRKSLSAKGYYIIGTIGDQWSDLEGQFAILKIKIPNYIYKIN